MLRDLHTPPSLRATSPSLGEELSSSYKPVRAKNIQSKKSHRRELRNHGTIAEATLWKMLKGKRIAGLQFRRQYSVGNYILDFYCPQLKLAIELDGDYHYHMIQPIEDYKRGLWLKENFGITVLRFENKVVFRQNYIIVNAIMQFMKRAGNSPSKLEGVPQRGGGVCDDRPEEHTPQSLCDSSPSLGEQHSSPSEWVL